MKRFTMFACLALVLVFAMNSFATEPPVAQRTLPYSGGGTDSAKASRDTFVIIGPWGGNADGSDPGGIGTFEDELGNPSWNGWTHQDLTAPAQHWQLSDYQADNLPGGAGNTAMWCGLMFDSCDGGLTDPPGGYGNNWYDILEFRMAVANPAIPVTVTFDAWANIDSEPGYDYTYLFYQAAEGLEQVLVYDDKNLNVNMNATFTIQPADYEGVNSDQIVIQVVFDSDGAWSDEDCLWGTAGALQIDDITVTLDGQSHFTDFEDGDWGEWFIGQPDGVGDFSKLWTNLDDIDECNYNYSTVVAFIDDGEVVPELPGSQCVEWCYGPSGYIVNTQGGLAGPDFHLHNAIESPVIAWPNAEATGALLRFDIYNHEELTADSPGMFYTWGIKTTAAEDPSGLDVAPWNDRGFVYYGQNWIRVFQEVTDLMEPGRLWTQVQFTCYEIGYIWDAAGDNGTPAPYFDNIRFITYPFVGPGMSYRAIDIANDNFPENGEVDVNDLGSAWVRFDMANTKSTAASGMNVPGDSVVVDINIVREGAEFVGQPELFWVMQQNAVFNPYRDDLATEGVTEGVPAVGGSGVPSPGKWAFDLPDTNFLFPGDVLHYYISATDAIGGANMQTATLPATDAGDMVPDGFGDFSGPLAYDTDFTVRGLPSLYDDPVNPDNLITPKTLFWNDLGGRGGENEWYGALGNLGRVAGKQYDIYHTNGPSSGVGNGIGGRGTPTVMSNYENVLYTSGNLGAYTISNGDGTVGDGGDDIGLLTSWLNFGDRDLFMTGDDLVSDLYLNGGATTIQFMEDWMKVSWVSQNLRPLVNNQATPLVKAVVGNGVFGDSDSWIAYGGCFGINTFDTVNAITTEGGVVLAEFTDPNGGTGAYGYSAATLYEAANGSRVISMPYDFMYVNTPVSGDKENAALPARAILLEQVLAYFGVEGDPQDVTAVPEAQKFALRAYPNPFNPTTKIEYTMPKAGHLTLKIYNVKGELVKTLIDDQIDASGHIMWDGTNQSGAKVSSGVYFSEARTDGQVKVNKMALVK